jgi:glycosyltransferase involved in cell wall biosynthesis
LDATVSAVIATYESREYAPKAVESALSQSVAPLDVVVVDDGSTDGTVDALAPYRECIRYVRQDNRGQAAARNVGAAEAAGEWLAFLDADDAWEPERISTLLEFAGEREAASAYTTAARVMRADGSMSTTVLRCSSPDGVMTATDFLDQDKGSINGSSVMVRREIFESAGGFDETLRSAEDVDLWLRLTRTGPIVMHPEPLLLYRTHGKKISGNRLRDAQNWLRLLAKLEEERPEFVDENRRLFARCRAMQHLRTGRGLLQDGGEGAVVQAREHLKEARRTLPFHPRVWRYLLTSYLR